MDQKEKVCSRPFSRTVALLLWTCLVGGALAVSGLVLPRALHSFEEVGVVLPALTSTLACASTFVMTYWYAVLGGYLLGVVVIGTRVLDRMMTGVIVLLALSVAGLTLAVAAGILHPLWNISKLLT